MKKIFFVFFIITCASIFVHFRNYSNLVNFNLDPSAHLTGARDMVNSGKISLVGPMIESKDVDGRKIFLGPFYYYVLAILGILTHWNVILISGFFTCIWIATFIIFFFWLYKRFGWLISILIYTLLSFYPSFVQTSRQIWNPHFIPLFGTLFLMYLIERKRPLHYFLAGIFWGLGLNVHYVTVLWVFIAGFFIVFEIYHKIFKWKNWLMLLLGIILAEFPLILFEFRHNFYNINTIIFQLKYAKLSAGYTFDRWYYYVLPFLPLAVFSLGKFLFEIRKKRIYFLLVTLLTIFSVYLIAVSFGSEGQKALYPTGWSINKQKEVVDIIIKDGEKSFEVAETMSPDTRAMDIRWWLVDLGVNVMDVAAYNDANVLYLVANPTRPPETENVWEVSSLKPFKVAFKKDLGEGILLYKLIKL